VSKPQPSTIEPLLNKGQILKREKLTHGDCAARIWINSEQRVCWM